MIDLFGELNPLLVIVMVIGLVELAKKLGVDGNKSLTLSMVIGVAFGVAYQLAEMYPAVYPWFGMVVFGLLTGLAASGLYDVGKRFSNG